MLTFGSDQITISPDELWEINFQFSSVLIFKASEGQIDEAEVLNVGSPSEVTNLITNLA
jgi:hypothetical protein